jgi:NitT/TauT family transport system ATP-binding protein
MTGIEIRDVTIRLGGRSIIEKFSLNIRPGEFICIVGASGSGKSTLLRAIGGLIPTANGTISVDGFGEDQAWRHVAYVFQSSRLMGWKTAVENVEFGESLRNGNKRSGREARRRRALELLALVGLSGHEKKLVGQLSGGQQQRVAIARALLVQPKYLLMDEPFSALDIKTRRHLRSAVEDIWKATGTTVVFVTHDIEEAVVLADRIVAIEPEPARIVFEEVITQERPRMNDTEALSSVIGRITASMLDAEPETLQLLAD